MERKIGEIFEYNGEWYQCVEGKCCSACCLYDNCFRYLKLTYIGNCNALSRNDKKSIIFKKLKKVGEPYVSNNRTFQLYKLAMPIYGDIPDQITGFTATEVVIKQNEEDMEENKLNLKPFDIQKAREGKPVCTRDGRKARIICFDKVDKRPIVALISDNGGEFVYEYLADGKSYNGKDDSYDLMMLPEKKEGWVNLYKSSVRSTKEEAIKYRNKCDDYIDTIKISWEE